MPAATLNQVLELADALPPDDVDILLRVLQRRRSEAWCQALVSDADKAEEDWKAGRLKAEPFSGMKARLRTTLELPDE